MRRRPVLSSVSLGLATIILVIAADFSAVACWQPPWLVNCISEPSPATSPPPAASGDPDFHIATSETFQSARSCTDRIGLPTSLVTGLLVSGFTYRKLRRNAARS